jgi:hypothetical protein
MNKHTGIIQHFGILYGFLAASGRRLRYSSTRSRMVDEIS